MPFADLLSRASRNEPTAIEELVAAFYPRVRSIAHCQIEQQVGKDAMGLLALFSTGDIVQEAFVAALRELPRFRGRAENELVAWLAALVHNRVVDAIRHHLAQRRDRRRHTGDAEGVLAASREPTPSQAMAASERATEQARVLASLSDAEHDLLLARLVDEMPWEAIAKTQGFPSADAARFAFRRLQARLMLQLARAGLGSATRAPEAP
ncbi:MAG TPA: sigma-70 family RNA polymerase sigma factor [Planctomycetota bacterium]|nr:sigma-70 family RNA polymerase sigma factor [Planctomycetota bacterium]